MIRFSPEESILIVMDMQGNLALRMCDKAPLFLHIKALIKTAKILDMPIIWTEQAPEKIGVTVEEIFNELQPLKPIKKQTFSAYPADEFKKELKRLKRKQIILCGIETHVCVYQTAADLLDAKYAVHIVNDAVSSRKVEDKLTAIDRLRQEGATIVSTEMMATELIGGANHPKFKEILQLIR